MMKKFEFLLNLNFPQPFLLNTNPDIFGQVAFSRLKTCEEIILTGTGTQWWMVVVVDGGGEEASCPK